MKKQNDALLKAFAVMVIGFVICAIGLGLLVQTKAQSIYERGFNDGVKQCKLNFIKPDIKVIYDESGLYNFSGDDITNFSIN